MLKTGDLIWIRKPFGDIYRITEVKTFWIPKFGGDTTRIEPAEPERYNVQRTIYYKILANASGKIVATEETGNCGDRFVVPFDMQSLLDFHQEKINALLLKPNDEKAIAAIEKRKRWMTMIVQNLS